MTASSIDKRHLSFFGAVLAACGVLYVILRFRDYSAEINLENIEPLAWFSLAICLTVYALANLLLAMAWRGLLRHFSVQKSLVWVIHIFGVSQIAKYVPGNIFHLAGRHVLGMAEGIAGSVLAKTLLWELILLAVTGTFFILLVAPLFIQALSIKTSAILFLMSMMITIYAAKIFLSSAVSHTVIYHFLFLSIAGLLFTAQFAIVSNSDISLFMALTISASFVVAWLAGFLTPGAPAGIGIREVVLLLLLEGIVPNSELLLAVVVGRAVSAGGDLLYFILSAPLANRLEGHS